jgi:hypothetical protein
LSIANLIRSMGAAGASPEVIAIAVEALEAAAIDGNSRRTSDRERKRRQREKSRDCPVTVTGQKRDGHGTPPETKVSPTPPSKTQTLITPLSPPTADGSPQPECRSAGEVRKTLAEWAEEIWQAASPRGRQRSSRKDVVRALEATVRRGNLPNPIPGAVRAYYASPDATKDGGEFAKGVHRLLQDDRWQAWGGEAEKPGMTDVSAWPDDRWMAAIERWRMTGRWAAGIGPPPDDPSSLAPPHLRISAQRTAA